MKPTKKNRIKTEYDPIFGFKKITFPDKPKEPKVIVKAIKKL